MKKEQRGKRTGIGTVFVALGLGALAAGLLVDAATVSQGIRDGLAVCGNVLIPSLFPFMVLSGFLSRTRYAAVLSAPLGPVTRRLYKLPGEMGVIVLLSLIGGYPVGARMIANLLEEKRISKETASRMLCFCVNSGPSFLISAVGVGMLVNKTAGLILFATQTTATLIIGILVSRGCADGEKGKGAAGYMPAPVAMVSAVSGASMAMMVMCAFATLFSGVLALLRSSGIISALAALAPVKEVVVNAAISGFFEVTSGCVAAAQVGGMAGFALISAIVSFSGLSVIFQVMSCFEKVRIPFKGFLVSRVAHGTLSTSMALPLYYLFCREAAVWTAGYPPILADGNKTWMVSVCLLAMCSILVLSAGRKNCR